MRTRHAKPTTEERWRTAAVIEARTWIGTPYRHQGRIRGQCVDCLGFVAGVARNLRLDVHDLTTYGEIPTPDQLLSGLSAHCDRRSVVDGDPLSLHADSAETMCYRAGDVLAFGLVGPSQPQHLGIATADGFIHAWNHGPRIVREQPWTRFWTNRLHSVWSFRWPLSS